MARTISRERKVGVMVQTAEGSPATGIVSGDLVQATELTLNPGQQQLVRTDFGFGRDEAGFVQGGNIEAEGSLGGHLILPGTFGVPQHERLLLSALSIASSQSFSTTINDTTPLVSGFDVTSATGLVVGDIVFVDVGSGKFEGRPISNIAGNTLTFAIDFSSAPADAATVQAEIYRLGTADQFLTLFDFLTNKKRQMEDCLVNELTFTFEDIVNFTAAFLASNVIDTSETEPAVPSFAGDAFARNFGDVWLDKATAVSSAFKKVDAYSLAIRILNNAARNPSPVGSQKADGVTPGIRQVRLDITIPVGTPTTSNDVYHADAVAKVVQRFFAQGSNSDSLKAGENVAWHMPKVELTRPDGDIDTSNPNAVFNFNDSIGFVTTENDSLFVAFG